MPRNQRSTLLGLAALVLVVAIVISVAGGGSDDDDSPTPTTTQTTPATATTTTTMTTTATATTPSRPARARIVIRDAKPVGGIRKLTFEKGSTIAFTVTSDIADEIHLHGYDVAKDVAADGSVRFDVPATIEGRFEVELEQRATPIATITVEP